MKVCECFLCTVLKNITKATDPNLNSIDEMVAVNFSRQIQLKRTYACVYFFLVGQWEKAFVKYVFKVEKGFHFKTNDFMT